MKKIASSIAALCFLALFGSFRSAAADSPATPHETPTLARIWPTNNNVGVSGFCHGLLFYGLGAADVPAYPSGESMLKVLTDEETAIRAFGKTPFVRTRNGVRYFLSDDPVFHTSVGESHRDQCLATFAAINLPLSTPIRLKAGVYSISNLLAESVANFSFDQSEPAWTAMAYAKYLPPKKEWTNRFGERTSFSRLAQYLLDLDWNSQSCGGTHIFGALVKIDKADGDHSILDEETRKRLKERVVLTLREAAASQQSDGGWNWRWCNGIKERNRPEGLPDRILVTGHLVELLNSLDARRRLPAGAYIRAGQWLSQSLDSAERDGSRDMICPLTHAARAAREALADR